MKSKQQSPMWPYLGILTCLFVLSITAPRAWDRLARQESLSQILAARKARHAIRERHTTSEAPPLADYEPLAVDETNAREPSSAPPEPAPQARGGADGLIAPTDPSATAQPPVPAAPEFAREVRVPGSAVEDDAPADKDGIASSTTADSQPADSAPAGWPLPRVLLEQLDAVVRTDATATWARQAIDLIHELCSAPGQNRRPQTSVIGELRGLLAQGAAVGAPSPRDEQHAAQLVRARYALNRWLDVWEPSVALDETRTADAGIGPTAERLRQCIADVEALLRQGSPGPAWRAFLELEALKKLAKDPNHANEDERRHVARIVLDRLDSTDLTRAQYRFVARGPIATLASDLRQWAAEPISSSRLLIDLERYEATGLPSDARLVADDWRGLNWSASTQSAEVSRHINTHYRNANIRVAVSRELCNHMVPQPGPVQSRVRDTVVNVPVYGRSTTFTKLSVRLVPDARQIRLGLEASGLVASDTVSTSGPARFYNEGQSTFLVRKLLVLGPEGLAIWPAVAEAENNYNYLVSMETGFDGVPLVGSLVRNIARSQHEELRDEARIEVEEKVAIRARDQFDAEVRGRLVKFAEQVEKKQVATLRRLGLELVPVSLSTSEERAVARVRLAAPKQLGAHTPRPQAPSDAWISLQVHQSALNNALESLDLNGRTFTLEELFAWVAKKLDRPELAHQEDLPENVKVTFAAKDAIRLICEDNRVEVAFSLAELTQGRNRWRNFTVRSFYLPDPKGLSPNFSRNQGTIFLEGKSLKGRPQVVLRAIFSKVLSRSRDVSLLDDSITKDPRFADLEITQFTIEHGWIGLAYSPRRAANVARRLK